MTARSRIAVAVLAAAGLVTAALTTTPSVAAPTPRAADSAPRAAAAPVPRTVYVTGDSNDKLAAHKIGAGGALTAFGTARDIPTDPEGVALSPDGRHAYVALVGSDQVVHVPINADGSLGTPDTPLATGDGPYQVVITPDGKYVYTADYSTPSISRFKVGPNGALTSLGTAFTPSITPYPMVVSPNGKFLIYGYTSSLIAASISSTGGLAEVGTAVTTNVDNAYDLTVSPDSKYVFSTNGSGDDVSAYSIATNGQLTAVGTPASLPAGSAANGAAMTPNGKFLYTANYSDDSLSVIAVGAGGSLSVVGTPVDMTGKGPAGAVVSPSGKVLYVYDYSSSEISVFNIAANGTLSEAAGSPYPSTATSPDYFAITTTPNQGPTAKIKKVKKGKAVVGKKVTLSAGKSSDPDGKIVRYVWKIGGKTKTTSKPKLKFTFKKAKTYTVKLRVIDNEGCSDVDISTGHTLHCNATSKAVTKIKVKVVKP